MRTIILLFFSLLFYLQSQSQITEVSYYDSTYTKFVNFERELKDSLNDGQYALHYPLNEQGISQIKDIITYQNNKKNGLFIEYGLNDGMHYLNCIGYYKNNLLDGQLIGFNQYGEMTIQGYYKENKRIGTWVVTIENNQKYILYYNNFGQVNKWELVDEEGNIISEGKGPPYFCQDIVN